MHFTDDGRTGPRWARETLAGTTGALAALPPVLTIGLLAFSPLGAAAPQVALIAAFVTASIGGLAYALISHTRMPVAGPSSATALTLATLVAQLAAEPQAGLQGIVALCALAVQIILGGWTSSNYAAVSCPDFPQCQAQWWPADMDYADAFVLWRGLDINYTGGVLEHPARVAIHFTHRLGAIVASLALIWLAVAAIRRAPTTLVRNGGYWVLAALGLQILIGILMVVKAFPLPLATGHNAGAAVLLLAALALNRRLREA